MDISARSFRRTAWTGWRAICAGSAFPQKYEAVVNALKLRAWATPLIIRAFFFLIAGTETVKFFKFDNGLIRASGELRVKPDPLPSSSGELTRRVRYDAR
jgi:hypothetical protein